MIQEISPKHLDNQFKNLKPDENSVFLSFRDRSALFASEDGLVRLPCGRDLGALPEKSVYLFSVDETRYFLTDLEPFGAFEYIPMFNTRSMRNRSEIYALATGWHLYVWYRDNQFCGRCGKKVFHSEKLRMLACPDCGNQIFPKICPAVITAVTCGDRILLTKYAGRAYTNYALIAGFIEIGETPEQCVAREVMEEVGVHVRNIRFFSSQPWGYDQDLLLGYFCELDGDPSITLDREELATAEWVDRKDVPEDTQGMSLTAHMMQAFRDGREK